MDQGREGHTRCGEAGGGPAIPDLQEGCGLSPHGGRAAVGGVGHQSPVGGEVVGQRALYFVAEVGPGIEVERRIAGDLLRADARHAAGGGGSGEASVVLPNPLTSGGIAPRGTLAQKKTDGAHF